MKGDIVSVVKTWWLLTTDDLHNNMKATLIGIDAVEHVREFPVAQGFSEIAHIFHIFEEFLVTDAVIVGDGGAEEIEVRIGGFYFSASNYFLQSENQICSFNIDIEHVTDTVAIDETVKVECRHGERKMGRERLVEWPLLMVYVRDYNASTNTAAGGA